MIIKGFYFIGCVLCTLQTIFAQGFPTKFGTCIVPEVKHDFEPESFFNGHWYKQLGFGSMFNDLVGVCPTIEFAMSDQGKIKSLDYVFSPVTQRYITVSGQGFMPSNRNIGYLERMSYTVVGGVFPVDFPLYIMDTDYDDYAIIYSCKPFLWLMKTEAAWIMSRSRNGTNTDEVFKQILNNSGLDYGDFVKEKNTECGLIEPEL